ncbi:AI-2E family transporter, partial [Melissococcus plutonius]|nr:AI-2E family transporter [Melissococcus plutonius]
TSVASDTTSVVTMIIVILTGMIFMVMDTPQMHDRLRMAGSRKPDVVLALESFASGIRKYWLVTTVFGLIVALFDWAALLIIGVPLAGVWALFSFLTNYIPNIGFIIGVIPPALLALFKDGWVAAVAVVVSYSVLNFVIQSIIQPKFAGDAVGLTPTMSFVSLLLWGWV